jgi:hypothetical protein
MPYCSKQTIALDMANNTRGRILKGTRGTDLMPVFLFKEKITYDIFSLIMINLKAYELPPYPLVITLTAIIIIGNHSLENWRPHSSCPGSRDMAHMGIWRYRDIGIWLIWGYGDTGLWLL